MMIEKDKRRWSLILLILALLGTLLISASLSDLQLHPGLPFPSSNRQSVASIYPENFYQPEGNVWRTPPSLLKILPLIMVAVFVYATFRHGEIRRTLFGALALASFVWFIAVILGFSLSFFGDGQQPASSGSSPPAEATTYSFQQGPLEDAPTIFVWLLIIGLVFLFIAIGIWLYRTSKDASTKEIIKAEAKRALTEIQNGEELGNVIVRCYLQMAAVIKTERGIVRDDSMTAQEFERVLVAQAFPETAVHALTTLFEKVRYGKKRMESNDEQIAIDCLNAITDSIGEGGDGTC